MNIKFLIALWVILTVSYSHLYSQPNWTQIKANATFNIPDTNYIVPQILSINVSGWEDGLYVTRNGKHLFSTYLPIDALSWFGDFSVCINFQPYYRGPLLGIDTITNIWGCPNYMQSDIIKTERLDTAKSFNNWHSSNLNTSFTFEGGACGVLLNENTFDVFVFTRDTGAAGMDLMFMHNVSTNSDLSTAVPILSTTAYEDNPHIERLPNGNLLLFFDRSRYMYYSISTDNGISWQTPFLITNVLNDQAPYDVQPHLWFDGNDWWVYFCANNPSGYRCIYRSKQTISDDWNSWGAKELVVEPTGITGAYGNVIAVGEPSLTAWGDLYFVTVYGNTLQTDTTDVFDCDPWLLKRKKPLNISTAVDYNMDISINLYPNPFSNELSICNLVPGTIIKIVDLTGKQVYKSVIYNVQTTINTTHFKSGIYILQLLEKGTFKYRKITISKYMN